MPEESDLTKALTLLVHDLRAPLSVAHGYLRLLKDRRLENEADRERALTQSLDALGKISRLCEDAVAFAAARSSVPAAATLIQAADLSGRVRDALGDTGFSVDVQIPQAAFVRVSAPDRAAAALATVIRSLRRQSAPQQGVSVRVETSDRELVFLAGSPSVDDGLASGESAPFDPWRGGHGLALPLACLEVSRLAGRVWTTPQVGAAIGVALPLEASTT